MGATQTWRQFHSGSIQLNAGEIHTTNNISMRGVFVIGTDTGVGKTVFAAGLAWALRRRKIDVGVMKPFATASRHFSKSHKSADVAMLAEAAAVDESDSILNPSFYKIPASPLMASELSGRAPPDVEDALQSFQKLLALHAFVIVEGIGGIMVPLTERHYLADFIELTGLPVIIVARPSLGTLNHTMLTVGASRSSGLPIAGIVINMMPKNPSRVEKNTSSMLAKLTGVPILGTIPRLSKPGYVSAGKAIEKAIDLDSLFSVKQL
jgi:dethiobiotin synthetase